jgi:hypothetical protein
MKDKYFILDKTIVLDNNYDIYMRQGIKFFITRTIYNQLKSERGYKDISKFICEKNISIVGYIHDFIDDAYVFSDLESINKGSFTYIYSNDTSIIEKLNNVGMDHCHIQNLHNEISNKKIMTNKFFLFISWRLKEMFYLLFKGVVIAISIIIAIFLLFLYPLIINYTFVKILLVILILPITMGLFIFRKKKRFQYGIIEIIFGIITLASIIINPTENTTTGIIDVLKLLGVIYITIRGLDNLEKGLKSPRYKKKWEKLFKKIE